MEITPQDTKINVESPLWDLVTKTYPETIVFNLEDLLTLMLREIRILRLLVQPQEEKIHAFVEEIREGAGWATDNYIDNFSPEDFTALDIFFTKLILAGAGELYDEDKTQDDSSEEPPEDARLHPSDL